jgi:hypothetical protein
VDGGKHGRGIKIYTILYLQYPTCKMAADMEGGERVGEGIDGTYRKNAGSDTLPRSSVKLPVPSMAALAEE